MSVGFDQEICGPVRTDMRRPVRLPSVGTWLVGMEGGAPVLGLTLQADDLGRTLQTDAASAPFFLLAFGYWHARVRAQADLWSTSPDGRIFHLFELKVRGNEKVGALPELLIYAWILHHVHRGAIVGGGPRAEGVRRAERMTAWLVAPAVHPLLLSAGRTPLEWVAEGLREDLDLAIAFYEHRAERRGFGRWLPARTWRSVTGSVEG